MKTLLILGAGKEQVAAIAAAKINVNFFIVDLFDDYCFVRHKNIWNNYHETQHDV